MLDSFQMPNVPDSTSVPGIFCIPGLKAELFIRQEAATSFNPAKSVIIHTEVAKFSSLPLSKLVLLNIEDTTHPLAFLEKALENVEVYRRPFTLDVTRPAGWYIETRISLTESMAELHAFMKTVLNMKSDQATLIMRLRLSNEVNALAWNAPLTVQSFIMEGLLTQTDLELSSAIKLTDIGIRLMVYRNARSVRSSATLGFGVFGILHLEVSKSVLEFSFDITVIHKVASLYARLRGDIWADALGIEGLTLSDIVLIATLPVSGKFEPTFAITATLQLKDSETVIALAGSYSANDIQLSAHVENLDWELLDRICHSITGHNLQKPQFAFHLQSATISISTQSGFYFEVEGLQVHDYHLESATLALDEEGLSVSGTYRASLNYEPWILEQISVHCSIGWEKPSFAFRLEGIIKHEDLVLAASVEVERNTEGSWEWAIHGALATATDDVSSEDKDTAPSGASRGLWTSDLFPALRGSVADIHLSELAISIGSEKAPRHSKSRRPRPAVGVKIYAILSSSEILASLSTLSGTKTDLQLELAATYTGGNFTLNVNILGLEALQLGPDIRAERFGLAISPQGFAIEGGVTVAMGKHELDWILSLAITTTGVAGYLRCDGIWNDPFGVGKHITVQDLGAGIALTLPAASPTVGFKGTVYIGEKFGKAEIQVSADPSCCFFDVTVQNIDLGDFIWLLPPDAPSVIRQTLLDQKDLVKIKLFALCVAPRPIVLLSGRVVQAGISFTCDCTLFGKNAYVAGIISTYPPRVGFTAKVDPFELGPLKISSASGAKQAVVSFDLSVNRFYLKIDGAITLLSLSATALVLYDQGKFTLDCQLRLDGAFDLKIQGYSIGETDLKARKLAEFYLHITFEQDIHAWIDRELKQRLSRALKDGGHDIVKAGISTEDLRKLLRAYPLAERRRVFNEVIDQAIHVGVKQKEQTPNNPWGWAEDRLIDGQILVMENLRKPIQDAVVDNLDEALGLLGDSAKFLGQVMYEAGDYIENANITPTFSIKLVDIRGTMTGLLGLPNAGERVKYKVVIQFQGQSGQRVFEGVFSLDMNAMATGVFEDFWKEVKEIMRK